MVKEEVSKFRDAIIRENNKVRYELRHVFEKETADYLFKDLDNVAQLMRSVESGIHRVDVTNKSSYARSKVIDVSEGALGVEVFPDEISGVSDVATGHAAVKVPFLVTYDFDESYFQFRGYVYKGYYDGLAFVKDEHVLFELDSSLKAEHLTRYMQALRALDYSISSNFPETLTLTMPQYRYKLDYVGDKLIDDIITNINKYDINIDDEKYDVIRHKIFYVSDVLEGVRLLSANKYKVDDYDAKMERVVTVLKDFEQELSDVTNENRLDLDTFEIALRKLEQQSGMSI